MVPKQLTIDVVNQILALCLNMFSELVTSLYLGLYWVRFLKGKSRSLFEESRKTLQ